MALKGTLKDFGIADILQLIGQQQKTGVLMLKAKEQEVKISFKDGSIVGAESSTRKKKDLIGAMLVRAEIIDDAQLTTALEGQRRTLQRLGDVLVASGMITHPRFQEMMQLQATETLYRLFSWKTGTYAFDQGEVDVGTDAIPPLRAESVLMEGFRMVDEWPAIKRKISRYDLTFERLKELPRSTTEEPDEEPYGFGPDSDLDSAFDEEPPKERKSKSESALLGPGERRVFALVRPSRDVRKLIDLSCLGEFETCKALSVLIGLGYLRALASDGVATSETLLDLPTRWEQARGALGRVLVTMFVLVALIIVAGHTTFDSLTLSSSTRGALADPAGQRLISRAQVSRIHAALAVYRLEKGELPVGLEALPPAGLLSAEDLHYPWKDRYYYRRTSPDEFILLPPLR